MWGGVNIHIGVRVILEGSFWFSLSGQLFLILCFQVSSGLSFLNSLFSGSIMALWLINPLSRYSDMSVQDMFRHHFITTAIFAQFTLPLDGSFLAVQPVENLICEVWVTLFGGKVFIQCQLPGSYMDELIYIGCPSTEFPIPSFVIFRHVLFWKFPWPAWAVASCRSGPQAGELLKTYPKYLYEWWDGKLCNYVLIFHSWFPIRRPHSKLVNTPHPPISQHFAIS